MPQHGNLIMDAREDGVEKTIDSRMHHGHCVDGNRLVPKHEPVIMIATNVQWRPHRVRQSILRSLMEKRFHHGARAAGASHQHE